MDKDMLTKVSVVLFFVSNAMCNEATGFKSFYGIKTDEYPKSSCHKISEIKSKGRCLEICGTTIDNVAMISHDESTKVCMCCSDLTGSDLSGLNWKSYIPAFCADGYATYNYTDTQICLKYVPIRASYPKATEYCQAEGGDLIRLDSKAKHDILTEILVPIANGSTIDVWIQGIKVENELFFHDKSRMPTNFDEICPLSLAGDEYEIHVRARGSSTFTCHDMNPTTEYSFMCEYYRHFTKY